MLISHPLDLCSTLVSPNVWRKARIDKFSKLGVCEQVVGTFTKLLLQKTYWFVKYLLYSTGQDQTPILIY